MKKYLILGISLFVASCSTTDSSKDGEGSINPNDLIDFQESDIEGYSHIYSDHYFSNLGSPSPANDFPTDFNQCHTHYLTYIASRSKGYKVMKSLGRSDQDIVSKGTIDCLFVKNWLVYKQEQGVFKKLAYSTSYLKTEASLTDKELQGSKTELAQRKEWYKKYYPELVQ